MTDRERRLLDAAKFALKALERHGKTARENTSLKYNAIIAIKSSLQEYFGSERQDT